MTFTELLQEVYNLTARPDLVDLTKTAVKAATLKAHQTDFYSKDIHEQTYQFTAPDYYQSLDYITLIPNYRALKYIRLYDPATSSSGALLDILAPEEILDEWGRERTNVAYVAGRVIEIKANVTFDIITLGCYVLPIVTEAGYSSWVASMYPYAIIHEAARVVFGAIAQQAEAASQAQLVLEQYVELKINAIPDVGY